MTGYLDKFTKEVKTTSESEFKIQQCGTQKELNTIVYTHR